MSEIHKILAHNPLGRVFPEVRRWPFWSDRRPDLGGRGGGSSPHCLPLLPGNKEGRGGLPSPDPQCGSSLLSDWGAEAPLAPRSGMWGSWLAGCAQRGWQSAFFPGAGVKMSVLSCLDGFWSEVELLPRTEALAQRPGASEACRTARGQA